MKCPFPGMDPYIEVLQRWSGFHMDFLSQCMHQLNALLPEQYVATLGDRIELIDEQEVRLRTHAVGPDVSVINDPFAGRSAVPVPKSPLATLEPHTLAHDIQWLDLPKQLFVEITHLPDENVVTDIEILSPSNKRAGSKDRLAYLTKRKNLLVHYVNLVEFDLLLRGARLPLLEPLPKGDYFGFVTHGPNWHESDVYGCSVRDSLPTLPVPLLPEDGEVPLNLATAFTQTYELGRYGRLLRYGKAPEIPLPEIDRLWLKEVLGAAT